MMKTSLNVYNISFTADKHETWQKEVNAIMSHESDENDVTVIGASEGDGKTYFAALTAAKMYSVLCNTTQHPLLVIAPDHASLEVLMHLTYQLLKQKGYTDVKFALDYAQNIISVDACDAEIVFLVSQHVKPSLRDNPFCGGLIVDDADHIDGKDLLDLRSYASMSDVGAVFLGNEDTRLLRTDQKDIWGNLLTDPFATVIYVHREEAEKESDNVYKPDIHLFMFNTPEETPRQSQAKEDAMTTLKALLGDSETDVILKLLGNK